MIQTGYSAGQHSKPAFGWVRNLERKNELTPEFLASADYQTSCLFALGWNICCAQLPKEVMDGWVKWLENSKLPRMDAGVCMTGTHGDYHIHIGEDTVTFHDAELAPPTGLLNQNYARSVQLLLKFNLYSKWYNTTGPPILNASPIPTLPSGFLAVHMLLTKVATSISPRTQQGSFSPQTLLFFGAQVTTMGPVLPTNPHPTHLLHSSNSASLSLPLHG